MKIRSFQKPDTPQLIALFRNCVHEVCKNDYTPEQLNAWASAEINAEAWQARFLASYTLVVEDANAIRGFANLENDGTVDMLYVDAGQQGLGIGKNLLHALKKQALKMGLNLIQADVSITAKPFFLKMGFRVQQEYKKLHHGLEFKNTLMSLQLTE